MSAKSKTHDLTDHQLTVGSLVPGKPTGFSLRIDWIFPTATVSNCKAIFEGLGLEV